MYDNYKLPDLKVAAPQANRVHDCGVWNFESIAMRLTRGKLIKTKEWFGKDGWQQLE